MISELKRLLQDDTQLVFDFDLTIAKMKIDWSKWHEGVSKIYEKYDPHHGYQASERDAHVFFNKLAVIYGEPLSKEIREFNADYEKEYLKGFIPNEDLITFIKDQSDRKMYLYSTNSFETVKRGLQEFELFDLFNKIITRDDVFQVKPVPEGFSLIEGFAENKHKFLMIGDSNSDQGAAKAAGIDFIRCKYFFS